MEAKDVISIAPGGLAIAASYLGLINTLISIIFVGASLAFLIWRWRQAVKEKDNSQHS